MTTDPRTLAIPCRAAGCACMVGLVERADGTWRGACSACGAPWSLVPGRPERVPYPPRPIERRVPGGGAGPAFGPALKAARLDAGLRRERLAATVGVDPSTVTRLETGNRVPSWSLLVKLLGVLPGLAAALAGEAERTAA